MAGYQRTYFVSSMYHLCPLFFVDENILLYNYFVVFMITVIALIRDYGCEISLALFGNNDAVWSVRCENYPDKINYIR